MQGTAAVEEILNDVEAALKEAKAPSRLEIDAILTRAGELKGLSIRDAAALLMAEDEGMVSGHTRKSGGGEGGCIRPARGAFRPVILIELLLQRLPLLRFQEV